MNSLILNLFKKGLLIVLFFSLAFSFNLNRAEGQADIGVILGLHGGMNTYQPQYLWDSSVDMFSYDPNHPVYKFVIWNSAMWGAVLQEASGVKFIRKYAVQYERIGGIDPFHTLSDTQLADMKAELDANPYGLSFEVDWVGWMAGNHPDHYAYPRFIYYGPDGGDNVTYCGEDEEGGPWLGCDPNRFDVDGPVERLLAKGVSRIIMVDLAVGGVRFYKAFDPLQMTKRAIDDWNDAHATSIPYPIWVNDYSNLMERSYPTEPEGWTPILGTPTTDQHVLLNGSPNPFAFDPELALLHVEGIEASMSETVSDAETGVILANHALFFDIDAYFDPKIDDTNVLNKNIKSQLIERHPDIDPDNIVGAYWGIKELNPENGLVELNWEQRGENLGGAYLYESDHEMPGEEWGYRCWDALEYLKDRGVKHIVIGFPQVITDSVLTSVEFPNQLGKEVGIKTWAKWGTWDYVTYPGVGHPFLDYWGPWVDTDCGEWDLDYGSGTSGFTPGATLTGQNSGATGVIKWFSGGVAAGTLSLKEVSGTFQDNETITDDKGGSALADGSTTMTAKAECCFTMGGCGDPLRPYPPPRQTPINKARADLDPSLAFDLSDYGHIGYDPGMGAPDPNAPVQDQYTGTWEMYIPPSDDPGVGQLLAKHVLNAAVNPMVYITNGELEGIPVGGSVTFEAHVTGGGVPEYTYEWSIKEEGDPSWSTVGGNSSTWSWNPVGGDEGTYDVHCKVTDSQNPQGHTGEVIFEGFVVSEMEFFKVTLKIGDVWANCGEVGVKIPICLENLENLVGGFQMDLCEPQPDDCLECTECELTERTTMFDCVVNELDNGCCRVILFSKHPGGLINPGECDIVIIVYKLKDEPQCCNTCIDISGENIFVTDEYGYLIESVSDVGSICPWMCGDIEPDESSPGAKDCGDGDVDIFDILEEVAFALGTKTPDGCQSVRANVPTGTPPNCLDPDEEGVIDILDIMVIIDMALHRQDCCSYYYGGKIY